jgi:hypothetical protein
MKENFLPNCNCGSTGGCPNCRIPNPEITFKHRDSIPDETLDKGWEDRFDDEFVEIFNPTRPDASIVKHPRHDDIKQFITNLLAEQKAEIIERVDLINNEDVKNIDWERTEGTDTVAWHNRLEIVLKIENIIKSLIKEI